MTDMCLKRGWGLVFSGYNWDTSPESRWEFHRMFVPSGREPMVGTRRINGEEHAVFQCLDDDFFAQPVALCRAAPPLDPCEVVRPPPPEEETGGWRGSRDPTPAAKAEARPSYDKRKAFRAAEKAEEDPRPGESIAAGRPAAAQPPRPMVLEQPDDDLLALARPFTIRK